MQSWDNGLVVGSGPNKIFIAREHVNHFVPLHAIGSVVSQSGNSTSSHSWESQTDYGQVKGLTPKTLSDNTANENQEEGPTSKSLVHDVPSGDSMECDASYDSMKADISDEP
eukprot:7256803-Karenia_brevis.AAC.1